MDRLARLRVPAGFVSGAVVWWLAQPTLRTLAWGAGIGVAGEALRFWAAGHLNKSREVTASGPYRWLAHPLYVGSSVIGVGLAVAADRVVVTVIIAAYLAVMLTAAIRSEEAFLRRAFGDGYDRYRRGQPAGGSAAPRRFALAQAVANREHRALVGLVASLLMLLVKATYNDSFWRAVGAHFVKPGG
jgi:hypothetical protein